MKKALRAAIRQLMPLVAGIFLALLAGGLALLATGANPLEAYAALVGGSFGSLQGLSETLVKAVPLLFVGLGICIAFRGGVFNIGGEGQIIVGGLAATATAVGLEGLPAVVLFPLTMLSGILAGAVWGGIAGILRARLMVNEVLSTIMLNVIAAQLSGFLLNGPMIDPWQIEAGTGIPISASLPEQAWIPRIVSQRPLHWGLVIALVLAVVVYVLLWKTTIGYNIRAVGLNPKASRKAGISVQFYQALVMILSGAFAGLAGAVEVMGVHHRMMAGVSGNYGYSGIVVALFGKLHPFGAIPASVLFGGLLVGGDKMQRATQVPASLVAAVLGMVVLFVVASEIWNRKRPRVSITNE